MVSTRSPRAATQTSPGGDKLTRARWFGSLLLLALAASLAACAEMQPRPASDPLPARAAAPAAPATATAPSLLPASASQQICLRVILAPSQAQAQAIWEKVKNGDKFLVASREVTRDDQSGPKLRCLDRADLEPEVLAAVQDLPLGQVAPPFALGNRWALALRTSDAYWRRGNELFDQGRFAEAEAMLLQEVELNPDGPGWHLIALARSARKQPREALAAYDQALAWSPLDPRLLNDKAGVLLDLGRAEEACGLYEKALNLAPRNALVMNNLAWSLARQGKELPRAEDLARQAVAVRPDNASFWDTLGLVQRLRGENAQAARSYHQALRLDPGLAQARAHLTPTLLALEPGELERLLGSSPASQGPTPTRR